MRVGLLTRNLRGWITQPDYFCTLRPMLRRLRNDGATFCSLNTTNDSYYGKPLFDLRKVKENQDIVQEAYRDADYDADAGPDIIEAVIVCSHFALSKRDYTHMLEVLERFRGKNTPIFVYDNDLEFHHANGREKKYLFLHGLIDTDLSRNLNMTLATPASTRYELYDDLKCKVIHFPYAYDAPLEVIPRSIRNYLFKFAGQLSRRTYAIDLFDRGSSLCGKMSELRTSRLDIKGLCSTPDFSSLKSNPFIKCIDGKQFNTHYEDFIEWHSDAVVGVHLIPEGCYDFYTLRPIENLLAGTPVISPFYVDAAKIGPETAKWTTKRKTDHVGFSNEFLLLARKLYEIFNRDPEIYAKIVSQQRRELAEFANVDSLYKTFYAVLED